MHACHTCCPLAPTPAPAPPCPPACSVVVLNDIHIDIMDYIVPATCADVQFRSMWAEFEWENKVAVNTSITEPMAFLDHIIASTNMVRTPGAALSVRVPSGPASPSACLASWGVVVACLHCLRWVDCTPGPSQPGPTAAVQLKAEPGMPVMAGGA